MKRYTIGLFPLILCFMIFGCSANPNTVGGSFMYGWKEGDFASLDKDKFYKINLEGQDGQLDNATKFYKFFLEYAQPADTINKLIYELGEPNYIARGKHTRLAFMSDENIYTFRTLYGANLDNTYVLIQVTPITYEIPGFSGKKKTQNNKSDKPARTIAVMDFSGIGLSTGEAQALTERLRLELFNVGSFKLLERGMMEQVLQEQGFQQTGCVDSECMVEVGNLIGVELMVGGSISKVGTVHSVSAKIFSVSTGEIVKTAQLDFRGDIGDLMLGGMKKIAEDLSDY